MLEIITLKICDLRTYEYHIEGAKVVAVYNHQGGRRHEMPFRKGRVRSIYRDKKGSYIKLDRGYKHYVGS